VLVTGAGGSGTNLAGSALKALGAPIGHEAIEVFEVFDASSHVSGVKMLRVFEVLKC
jgi:hypothetical protein